jgi:hypothetical protein
MQTILVNIQLNPSNVFYGFAVAALLVAAVSAYNTLTRRTR